MRRVSGLVLGGALCLSACSFGPQRSTRLDATRAVEIRLVDEAGQPVESATYAYEGGSQQSDAGGSLEIAISAPVAGVITAQGMLPEPLVVAPRDGELEVTLLASEGPNGPRQAIHFGGDVMLGRRYQTPTRLETAVATGDEGARSVVSSLAAVSAAADATIVNTETVIGELPLEQAYQGKRFLIQSPPAILAALDELGVDLVTLGNNHAFDWRDEGVASTIAALDAAGMPHTGAGLTADEAIRGAVLTVRDRQLGFVSVTTVNGDFVNDSLPPGEAPIPDGLAEAEAWQYEVRSFGFGEPGQPGSVPLAARRARDAWDLYRQIEPEVSGARAAALWSALTAEAAYPELQDWVARRGHGGAANYDRAAVRSEIERLRADGADTVIVQFHAGFQFAQVKSAFVRQISHDAIDDGADMVVSHHPHVLQGVEWYQGRLIAYSLGNLVFDQDFLATFPSALLRVVVDDLGVVQARLIPVMLVDYRPVPVVGDAAERIVRLIGTRSALPAESERIVDFLVGGVLFDEYADGVQPATVDFERNSGVIEVGRSTDTVMLQAGPVETASVPSCLALRADQLPDGVEYAVDLFGWGRFDDMTADGERGAPMHWITPELIDDWTIAQGASPDAHDDALQLVTDPNRPVVTRFAARSTLAVHRLFDSDLGHPADGEPTYSLEFDARLDRAEGVAVRLDVYDVNDADPTSDPTSTLIRTVAVPIDLSDDDQWDSYTITLDPSAFAAVDEVSADAVMITITVEPAFRGKLTIDNFRLLEWRQAPRTTLPMWTEVDALRAAESQRFEVSVSGCENV